MQVAWENYLREWWICAEGGGGMEGAKEDLSFPVNQYLIVIWRIGMWRKATGYCMYIP